MREDLPSLTAMIVSFSRGFGGASRGECRDPVAETLLPRPLGVTLRALRRGVRGRPALERLVSLATLDTIAHASLRTSEIDLAVTDAMHAGTRQVVLVGAGLDARAYRLETLRDAHVFEVDHPATQRLKRGKARTLTPKCRALTHVSVDFGRDDLEAALAGAGHDAAAPTLWIWEGVTMYLPLPAIQHTLGIVARRSAPGSTLVVTYVVPRYSSLPAALEPVMHAAFSMLGEPLLGAIATDAMHEELAAVGFETARDTTSETWAREAGEAQPLVHLFERVLVARKSAAA